MSYINLKNDLPGIRGLMAEYPETESYLCGLANELLRSNESLTSAEREMIATYVSSRNECRFCTMSHAAIARAHLAEDGFIVDEMLKDKEVAPISNKMKALLTIADKIRQDGRLVTPDDVEYARSFGADDRAIHDTALITAAFCMFNRYVEGLGTWAPEDPEAYRERGNHVAKYGYSVD